MSATNIIEILINGKDNVTGVLSGVGEKIGQLGANITQIGVQATAITAPITAAFGVALNSAVEFDETMTNVGSVLGKNHDQMQGLNDQIIEIGRNSRAGPQQAAEAFYDIAGGVADASTHMDILKASIKTAEAGNASLGSTTSALISVMNSYQFSADKASFASDVLTKTVGMGVGTMDQFASAMPQVTGMASKLSVGFDEVGSAMAFMTTKGFSASQTATQLTGIMTAFLKPNKAMEEALKSMGFTSGSAAIKQLGLVGTVQKLSQALGGSQDEMAKALGSTEALTGATTLSDQAYQNFSKTFQDGIKGATDAAQAIQLESPAAQMDLLRSNIASIGLELGKTLVPALNGVMKEIKPFLDKIFDWIKANPQLTSTIVKVLGAVALIGPVLIGVGMAISLLASPVTLIVGAIAALGLAFATNFLGIRDVVQPVIDYLSKAISGVMVVVNGVINILQGKQVGNATNIMDYLFGVEGDQRSAVGYMLETFGMLPQAAEQVSTGIINAFLAARRFVVNELLPTLQMFADWFLTDALPAVLNFVQSVVIPGIQAFFTFLGNAWGLIKPALDQLFNWFVNDALPAVVGFIQNTVIPGIQSFVNFLQNLWAIVQPKLQELYKWFVEEALPAVLSFITGTVVPAIQGFIDTLIRIWNDVSPFLLQIADWFLNTILPSIVSFITDTVVPTVQSLIDVIVAIWVKIEPGLKQVYDWFMNTALPAIIGFIKGPVTDGINGFINIIAGLWNSVKGGLDAFKNNIDAVFKWIHDNVIQPFIDVINGIKKAIDDVSGGIGALTGAGQNAGIVANGLASGQFSPGQVIGAAWGAIRSEAGFAGGGYTGDGGANEPAGTVHKGEWVVPQDGALVSKSDTPTVSIAQVIVNANDRRGGEEAADGFWKELEGLMQQNGVILTAS